MCILTDDYESMNYEKYNITQGSKLGEELVDHKGLVGTRDWVNWLIT